MDAAALANSPAQAGGLAALPWDFALLLAALAVVVPWRGRERVRKLLALPELTSADRMAIYVSTIGVQWLGAGVILWRAFARGLTFADLGLAVPDPAAAVSAGVVLVALTCGLQLVSLRRLAKLPPERHGTMAQLFRKLMPQTATESLAFAALAFTAGVCEEVIYRGFCLTVLERVAAGSIFVALLGSSALFALAHLYQGRRGLTATFIVGLIFAASRLLAQSLLPAMVAHFAVDLLGGVLAPRLLRSARAYNAETHVPPLE